MPVELKQLRYVVALAEELHFGRAAQRVHISQPPFSQQIQRLEEELGVKLFYRTKRQVVLLEAGQRFVEEARQILLRVDHATETAGRASKGEIGRLSVATLTAGRNVVIEALRLFGRRYPDVQVELRSMSTPAQLDALRHGQLDVGFVLLPIEQSEFQVEKVGREPLVVAVPPGHKLARYRRIPLKALAVERSILLPRSLSPGIYDHIMSMCRNAGFSPKIVHESDSILTSLALAAAGLGLSLIPISIARGKLNGLVFRELDAPISHLHNAMVYRREPQSNVVRSFLLVVRQVSTKFL